MSERHVSGLVDIADAGLVGMVTVRADLSDISIRNALTNAGFDIPEQGAKAGHVLWMSPDELMLMSGYESAEAQVSVLTAALTGTHSFVVNISDARCVFKLKGEAAHLREVLAKVSPADLRPASLPPGVVRRTRLAQVPAAFWFDTETAAQVICFRSVSDYVFDLLSNAAADSSAIGYF